MNWKNIKTFMIILLAAANIFLAVMLISQSSSDTYNSETADHISQLLDSSGISADRRFFELDTENAYIYSLEISADHAAVIAERLMGSVPDEKFITPDGIVFFSDDGSELKVSSDLEITYTAAGYNTAPVTTDDNLTSDEMDDIKDKLNELLSSDSSDIGLSVSPLGRKDNALIVSATQTIDGFEIDNHKIECVFEQGELKFLQGKWSFLTIKEKISAHLLDSVNILLNERNERKNVNTSESMASESDVTGTPSIVLDMVQCYTSQLSSDASLLFFMPAWRIEWQDSRPYSYFNAVNGEKIALKVNY